MQSNPNKRAVVEIGLKKDTRGGKVILQAYCINGLLNIGDTIELRNDTAKIIKYDYKTEYYSLSCNASGAFSNALGNIITVNIIRQK